MHGAALPRPTRAPASPWPWIHLDQIKRLAGGPDQDVGSEANAIARDGGFVDRGQGLVCKRFARRCDGELVVKVLVVDQHAAGKPLTGDTPDGMSSIEYGSRYSIDRRSESPARNTRDRAVCGTGDLRGTGSSIDLESRPLRSPHQVSR